MTDKQQIEEMAKIASINCGECYTCEFSHLKGKGLSCMDYLVANEFYNAGYRKVDQDYAELLYEYERVSEGLVDAMELVHKIKAKRDALEQQLAETRKETRKETAKEFLLRVVQQSSRMEMVSNGIVLETTYSINRDELIEIAKQLGMEVEE